MPARKMRVEVFDGDGNRYSISFEGQITREKALRLLDMVELLGGIPSSSGNPAVAPTPNSNELSKFDKVRLIVQKHFPVVWFSSRDVQSVYEHELREPISLSTVATYLARMAARGLVSRMGAASNLKYKSGPSSLQAAVHEEMR
jgi:hypothetical protein